MSTKAEVETVTADKASAWLATSRGNRRIYKAVVERYAREMAAGKWQVNGESIVFDHEGRLVNGHHRLHACQMAGKPFQTLVVRGVEPRAFDSFDSGLKRSAGDILELRGHEHGKELAATLVLLWRYENGKIAWAIAPTTQELNATLAKYSSAPLSVEACLPAKSIISTPVLAFVHCLGSQKDPEAADLFVASIIDGVNLSVTSPVRLLREKCMQARGRGTGRLPRTTLLAYTIKAYNYFAEDLPLGTLKWAAGETFPVFGEVDKDSKRAGRKAQAGLAVVQ